MLEALERWLAAAGARHVGVVVGASRYGRGLFAARPIAAGAVVVHVPRALMITRELAAASSLGRQLRAAKLELSGPHALIAAWLLVEQRDPRSRFRQYLETLPRDLQGFPLHAPPEERAILAGTIAGEMLDGMVASIDDDHAALTARVPLYRGIARDRMAWARLCVGSRLFGVTVDGVDTFALVPFADLLNHRREEHTSWTFDPSVEAFTLTALRDYAVGEELFDSYGDKPTARLLVQYGFVLEDNAADIAELRFPESFLVSRDPTDPPCRELVAWLLGRHRNWSQARAVLTGAVRAALAHLGAHDDEALLRDDALTPRARDFIRARRAEKQVLAWWLDGVNVTRAFALPPP